MTEYFLFGGFQAHKNDTRELNWRNICSLHVYHKYSESYKPYFHLGMMTHIKLPDNFNGSLHTYLFAGDLYRITRIELDHPNIVSAGHLYRLIQIIINKFEEDKFIPSEVNLKDIIFGETMPDPVIKFNDEIRKMLGLS